MSFENGLFLNLDCKLFEKYRKLVRSEIKIYENLDDYIGDYTTRSDIQLANFGMIFQYFCYLNVLIILTFVLNHIYRYGKVINQNLKKLIQRYYYVYIVYIVIILSKIYKYLDGSED